MRRHDTYLYVFLALTALTWWLGDPQFRVQALEQGVGLTAFPGEADRWQVSGGDDAVSIDASGVSIRNAVGKRISATLTMPVDAAKISSAHVFRVTGRVHRVSAPVLIMDEAKQTIIHATWIRDEKRHNPPAAVRFSGQFASSPFSFISVPVPFSDTLQIAFVTKVPGEWRLSELQLVQGEVSQRYHLALVILLVLWGLLIVRALVACYRLLGVWPALLTVAIAGLIALGVSLSQPLVSMIFKTVVVQMSSSLGSTHKPDVTLIMNVGHGVMFAMLTGVLLVCRSQGIIAVPVARLIAFCLVSAWASEAIQRHLNSRSAQWSDVLIDAVGIFCALILWWLLSSFQRRRKAASSS